MWYKECSLGPSVFCVLLSDYFFYLYETVFCAKQFNDFCCYRFSKKSYENQINKIINLIN